jgi:hypothetical protein
METLPLTGGLLTIPLMLIGVLCVAIGGLLSRITGSGSRAAFDDNEGEAVVLPLSWRAADTEALDPSR